MRCCEEIESTAILSISVSKVLVISSIQAWAAVSGCHWNSALPFSLLEVPVMNPSLGT